MTRAKSILVGTQLIALEEQPQTVGNNHFKILGNHRNERSGAMVVGGSQGSLSFGIEKTTQFLE